MLFFNFIFNFVFKFQQLLIINFLSIRVNDYTFKINNIYFK